MNGWLIYNAASGAWESRRSLERVVEALHKLGWTIDLCETTGPEQTTRLAQKAAAIGCDALWVAGGDGTIRDAAQGLVGSDTALAVLPTGTANVWAREIGLATPVLPVPGDWIGDLLVEDARILANGSVREVDVGRVNGRIFLLWAGVGVDSYLTSRIEPRSRVQKRLGMLGYTLTVILLARQFAGIRGRVSVDGRTVRGRMLLIVVSNVQLYAGVFRLVPQARLDDGLLNVFIWHGTGPGWLLHHAVGMFTGRALRDPRVTYLAGRSIEISTDEAMPVHLDGDPDGQTPMRLEAVPGALRVLVPEPQARPLFVHKPLKTLQAA